MRINFYAFFVAFIVILCLFAANSYVFADDVFTEDVSSSYNSDESEIVNENDDRIFHINKDQSRQFFYNGAVIDLFVASVVMDLNNDDITNVEDARLLLRISAKLDEIERDVKLYDISADGEISISDARLLLRYVSMLDVYYADEDACAISGWVADEDSDACYFYDNGMLASGYTNIDGKYYYFGTGGKISYGEVKAAGSVYYFDNKGIGFTGFQTIDTDKYYFQKGKALTGIVTIDGSVYGFSSKGAMLTGLNEIAGDYYFFSDSGKAYSGWKNIDSDKYYFIDGKAQKGLVTIDGVLYGFSENGEILKGLNQINGEYYIFTDSGRANTGWVTIDSNKYYIVDGKVQTGLKKIDGSLYIFSEKGAMLTGLKQISGDYYFFADSGKAQTGWVLSGSNKYYFGSDYKAVKGKQTISGKSCVFSDSCSLYSGYADINGNTYYYVNGSPFSGWLYEGLDVYYFYNDGKMAKSAKVGNASFNSKGVASCDKLANDTLQIYLRNILKNTGTSTKSIYNHVRKNYRYRYYAKSTPDAMVLRMLQNKRGACYDYAYLTKYLLEAAGYECYIVVGKSFNRQFGSEHDWVLVKVDGVWRHMDTQKGAYLKTDAQMKNLGYKWSAQGLPAAK